MEETLEEKLERLGREEKDKRWLQAMAAWGFFLAFNLLMALLFWR